MIIPGAQKAATSSLYIWLRDHPECLMSVPKEPMFFSRPPGSARLEDYQACFDQRRRATPKIVGEASTAYLSDPRAPGRIRDLLGSSPRFLIVVRSPAERAISAYWHLAKRGDERRDLETAFATALTPANLSETCAREEDLLARAIEANQVRVDGYRREYDDALWHFRYIANGRYSVAIARFRSLFPSDHVRIVLFEDLLTRPRETLADISAYLGIDAASAPEVLPVRNRTLMGWMPAVSALAFSLRHRGVRSAIASALPVVAAAGRFTAQAPPKPPRLLERLREVYEEETCAMSQLLDRELKELGW